MDVDGDDEPKPKKAKGKSEKEEEEEIERINSSGRTTQHCAKENEKKEIYCSCAFALPEAQSILS